MTAVDNVDQSNTHLSTHLQLSDKYVCIGRSNWSIYVLANTFHLSKSKTFDRLTGPQCHAYNGQATAVQCLPLSASGYFISLLSSECGCLTIYLQVFICLIGLMLEDFAVSLDLFLF